MRHTTCPRCGSADLHAHSLSEWCGRCSWARNFDGSVGRPSFDVAVVEALGRLIGGKR